jgi:signal transduction histidine kinase
MKDASAILVRAAGLAACLVVGLPFWMRALGRPEAAALPRFDLYAGAGALLLFAACFWLLSDAGSCGRLPRATVLSLLAVQILSAAFLYGYLLINSFTGILLVLVAAVVVNILSLRASLVLMALQTLAYMAGMAGNMGLLNATASTLAFASFEIFALYTSHIARSERRAREELARTNAELLATRKLLSDGSRTAERVRISRELHDVMGHHLTALSLGLEAARHAPEREVQTHVATARDLTKRLLHEVRQVVGRLREEPAIDLAGALTLLAEGIGTPKIHLALPEGLRLDDSERAHALVRCAQEILTNSMKHAGARNVWLEVVQGPEGVELKARDDGRGARTVRTGNGLNGMRERLEALGGRLAVDAAPGRGFQVTAWLPLPTLGGAMP